MKKHVSDRLLSSYVDGDLKKDKKVRIERHLERCKICSQRLAEFRSIVEAASKLEQVEVPEGMLVGIRARLADQGASQEVIRAKPRHQLGFWHGIIIGAALSAAVILFVVVPHIGIVGSEEPEREKLILRYTEEEAGPDLGLAKAQDFGETPPTTRTKKNYTSVPHVPETGDLVFTTLQQPVDSSLPDTSPRRHVIMEPLDEEARRKMLTQKGLIQVFPFEGPHFNFVKPKQDNSPTLVPVLEADTNTKFKKFDE
ncbi:zf-HC2 domain-containing protein [candidate division WOR-3 bacterium]|nr:zf-HC2 domain-containing protein [candidate division WOR-3 bacterium]